MNSKRMSDFLEYSILPDLFPCAKVNSVSVYHSRPFRSAQKPGYIPLSLSIQRYRQAALQTFQSSGGCNLFDTCQQSMQKAVFAFND